MPTTLDECLHAAYRAKSLATVLRALSNDWANAHHVGTPFTIEAISPDDLHTALSLLVDELTQATTRLEDLEGSHP
jgi:hypothetical protein